MYFLFEFKMPDKEDLISLSMVKDLMHVQERAILASINMMFGSVKSDIDLLRKDINQLQNSLEFTQKDVSELQGKANCIEEKVSKTQQALKQQDIDIEAINNEVEYLENQSRCNNIKIVGIMEEPNELSWDDTEAVVRNCVKDKLGMEDELLIERAHRVGKKRDDVGSTRPDGSKVKPRAIVVKLQSWKQKEKVLKQARLKRPKGVEFYPDYATRTLERRRQQIPTMLEARRQGKLAFFVMDKLVVKEKPPDGRSRTDRGSRRFVEAEIVAPNRIPESPVSSRLDNSDNNLS